MFIDPIDSPENLAKNPQLATATSGSAARNVLLNDIGFLRWECKIHVRFMNLGTLYALAESHSKRSENRPKPKRKRVF